MVSASGRPLTSTKAALGGAPLNSRLQARRSRLVPTVAAMCRGRSLKATVWGATPSRVRVN